MTILIYRTNSDESYAEGVREAIAEQYPDASVRELNPRWFDDTQVKADANLVVVRPRYRDVIDAYEKAGVEVVSTITETEEPAFTDPHEAEVLRLLSLSVRGLTNEIDEVSDIALLRLALEGEKAGRNRKTAVEAYEQRLEALEA